MLLLTCAGYCVFNDVAVAANYLKKEVPKNFDLDINVEIVSNIIRYLYTAINLGDAKSKVISM